MRQYPILLLFLVSTSAQGRIERIGPLTASSVPASVRAALEPGGYRVLHDGQVLCELWFRQQIPIRSEKTTEPGVVYGGLAESTFVGVIVFPRATTDYRGLAIQAGAYTLRYALHPVDGNHMGIAPNRDFLLLIPAEADPDVTARYSFQELVRLSAKATGTGHPGALSLRPAEGDQPIPTVRDVDSRYTLVVAKVKTEGGGEMTLALIVKGVAEL